MSESIDIPKVEIDPVGCYRQAFELVSGRYWLLVGIAAVGMFIAGAVPVVLIGPMMCGIYLCFLETYRGKEFDFGLLFGGFDHFVPSLIASLVLTGISFAVLIPMGIVILASVLVWAAAAQADGGQGAAPAVLSMAVFLGPFLLAIVLLIGVSMFFMFVFPLIADRELSGPDAVVLSARAVVKNFQGILGLTLIGMVLALGGVLACYVGTFFVMPISFAAMTIAYRKVFPEMAAGHSDPAPAAHAIARNARSSSSA